MERHADLQKKIFKIDNKVSEILQTHPNSSKRVLEVIENYQGNIPLNPIIGEEIFLKKIEGVIYGHKSNEGFFIKNTFIHKPLKIKFEFDEDFYFINNPKALIGNTSGKTKVIFDLDETIESNDLEYLSKWISISKKKVNNFRSFSNKNFSIITGDFKKKKKLITFGLLKSNEDIIYRFLMISNESESSNFTKKFQNIIYSFRKLSDLEIKSLTPPRIKIISTQNIDDLENVVSKKLNIQKMFSNEVFETLNNLDKKGFQGGKKIKTVY